jgi:transcriptional antiterminator RfaH
MRAATSDTGPAGACGGGAWYVVYTHPHAEAKALGHLARQGYSAYLPQCEKRIRHARSAKTVLRPLFPRYLFVWLDVLNSRWRPVLSTVGVCDLVRNGDVPRPVPSQIIQELRARETGGAFRTGSAVRQLGLGDRVRMVGGAFADLVGRFLGMSESDRVYVLLDLLNREIEVNVSLDAVQPA